ncbi:phage integrase N-terminal SAM-like domain-containing protein [Desulfatitalea alkaliphila]|uniref:phage integrase N-terminal SAM-like domain-containing protein n=1 Tax=Desulfatitalea alkaliphila TaxID=2929485 RepID=UPI003CCF9E47
METQGFTAPYPAHPSIPRTGFMMEGFRMTRNGTCRPTAPGAKTRAFSELPISPTKPPRLLDQVREALRTCHYSPRTETTYCQWIRRYIHFHGLRHPAEMAEAEVNAFLTSLAVNGKVSASTQNQALAALLFLYRYVIGRKLGDLGGGIRARKPKRLPVVLTRNEVKAVLAQVEGDCRLIAALMYGGGLRLMECFRLRVQDLAFARNEIHSQRKRRKGPHHNVARITESAAPRASEKSEKNA